jgi:hypothetical protein
VEPTDIEATLEQIRQALEARRVEEAIAALIRLRPADRAEAFADLPDDEQATLLPRLDIHDTADLLEELEDSEAADAAESLSPDRLADVLDEMEPDEAADILGDLSPGPPALADMKTPMVILPRPPRRIGRRSRRRPTRRRHTTAAQAIQFLAKPQTSDSLLSLRIRRSRSLWVVACGSWSSLAGHRRRGDHSLTWFTSPPTRIGRSRPDDGALRTGGAAGGRPAGVARRRHPDDIIDVGEETWRTPLHFSAIEADRSATSRTGRSGFAMSFAPASSGCCSCSRPRRSPEASCACFRMSWKRC